MWNHPLYSGFERAQHHGCAVKVATSQTLFTTNDTRISGRTFRYVVNRGLVNPLSFRIRIRIHLKPLYKSGSWGGASEQLARDGKRRKWVY